MTPSLHRAALVTGASSGIGRHIALRFAQDGLAVALADIDVAAGRASADAIDAAGGNARFIEIDVRDEASVARAVESTVAAFGRLDVVVNDAGGTARRTLLETSLAGWRDVLDLNLTSMFLVSRAAYPHLAASGRGAIVNLASLHAYATVPGLGAYAAAKAGVVALTRSLALEFAPAVRVNAIAPGLIETPAWLASVDDVEAARRHRLPYHPLGRLGRPDEVAGVAAFLISDDASFVTGVTVAVDGGLSAQLYREA
jgi:NAD(P)-dependent dehydrogenase (short-subunit alcohol dehydrogenase family)